MLQPSTGEASKRSLYYELRRAEVGSILIFTAASVPFTTYTRKGYSDDEQPRQVSRH
jgi:hypothetical protein